jgi:hypothetical protein
VRKQELTDNSGRWFDMDSAKVYLEAVMLAPDGTPVSRAAGNSWEHETLYLTTHGTFVMHFADEHNPTLNQFVEWDVKKAVKWLLANGHGAEVIKMDLESEERQLEL